MKNLSLLLICIIAGCAAISGIFTEVSAAGKRYDSDKARQKIEPALHSAIEKDGMILAVIETDGRPDTAEKLKSYNINIINIYRHLIKAYIASDDLESLASEEGVKFIRRPYKPIPMNPVKQQ